MANHFSRLVAAVLGACAVGLGACGGDMVSGPSVAAIRFVHPDYVVAIGAASRVDLVAYDARNNPIAFTEEIAWTSSDPSRVSVDPDGTLHGQVLGGPVTITASSAGKAASVGVSVRPASVTISPRPDSVLVGQSVQFVAAARAANGDVIQASAPIWSVTPSTLAAISPSGVLTSLAPGAFTVSVSIDGTTDELFTGVTSAYDGGWIAHTLNLYNNPQDILFQVRYGTVQRFIIPAIRTNCTGKNGEFNNVLNVPIVDGRFSYQMAFRIFLNGTFESPAAFTGAFEVIPPFSEVSSFSVGTITCPSLGVPVSVSVPLGAFTATRQ